MEVWVSGVGCLCAAGLNLKEVWHSLVNVSGPDPAPPERLLSLAAEMGLDEMSHPAFSLPHEAFAGDFRHSARDTFELALKAAEEAVNQAGLTPHDLADDESAAVVVGSTAGQALHFLADYADLKGGRRPSGQGLADFFNFNPAEAMARKWDLRGPALTVGNACCSGGDAIGLGLELIASGRCRRVLAGGADALSLVPYIGFRRLMIYSDQPCRPFDNRRKGLNLGEGAGFMLLEAAEAADKRGAAPLAKLLAYGAASDGHHLTAPHPEAFGLRRAIQEALGRSGLKAADLAFVNAHGTATPDNDRVEALAIRSELPETFLWAVKGSTGHTLGAAGALEAVLTVTALREGLLPASRGFAEPDSILNIKPTQKSTRFDGRAAISLSLGFGGGNTALIFGRI